MVKKFVELLSSKKRIFFAVLVLVNLFALFGVFRIKINPDITTLLPSDSPANKAYKEMEKTFNSGEQLIFVVEIPQYDDEIEKFKALRELQAQLEENDSISSVNGPAPKTIFAGLRAIKLEEITEKDIPLLKEFLSNLGELNPLIENEKQSYASFNIFLNPDTDYRKAVKEIEDIFENSGFVYYGSGNAFLQKKLVDYLLAIISIIPPLAAFLIVLVFRSQIGSTKNTILSIFPAGLGALWTIGFMGWTGKELSILTILAPIFTIIMGSADGIHFMAHFTDNLSKDRMGTVEKTLKGVGLPMIMTTLTTIAGFLSLLVTGSSAMSQLAIYASLGIGFAGIATWIFLPLVTLNIRKFQKVEPKPINTFLPAVISKLWGKKVVTFAAIYLFVAVIGFRYIVIEFNQLDFFKDSTQVARSFKKVKEINGGGIPLFAVIETTQDPLDLEIASKILEMETKLIEEGLVSKVISVYDVMSYLNKNAYNLDSPIYPKTSAIANLLFMMASRQPASPLSNFLLREEHLSRMMLFPGDLKSETLQAIKDTVTGWSNEDVQFSVVGVPYVTKEMNDSIINKQINSMLFAVAMVFVMLLLTFRNFFVSIYATIPIGITLTGMFGFMGYLHIPLNITTATMASITIGVGIDYAIHYSSYYRMKLKNNDSSKAARQAFAATSKPIIANAFGLAIGMSAMFASPLKIHMFMASLMWFTMVSSSVMTLALLPTMYSRLIRKPQ
ncbi:hypothetical protein AT15_05245 [Kosmotoga arenicorallina S304]|uniref:Membrane transport protein MMPL domain-containing protein n=1 Tax=Kosmotoga arenicorallina S304 TaxID=1453497 RepID=A0A176JUV4_9BACT|nr:MMPL family transporter [Kosmotoga arenicorallina]OAA27227.1 hypothetical protein AT15_05245 [Kosmotoga arenicorallina S304]